MPQPAIQLTSASAEPATQVLVQDEHGANREVQIAIERPLTIYLDKREIVTLMTLGREPELLVLGWLRNQRLVGDLQDIKAVQVDWETESAVIVTHSGGVDQQPELEQKLAHRTVTTGCGQGTVFGDLMADIDEIQLPEVIVKQTTLYGLLKQLAQTNEVYKSAGAVHGCALCSHQNIIKFVEDIGRHNAVDTIAGEMWLHDIDGADKIFYTTGRLTSEMVIKVSQMGVPILLSRSGVTKMGLEIAQKTGVTMIARAKGKHFLVYNGSERLTYDAEDN